MENGIDVALHNDVQVLPSECVSRECACPFVEKVKGRGRGLRELRATNQISI